MKETRVLVFAATLAALALGGGWVAAQTTPPRPAAAPAAPARPGPGRGPMGMGGGMMGMHMMGGGGMCPMMMGGEGTTVDVKNIDKGVTITITATDPAMVARVQKMAQGMRLMREAMTP